MQHYLQHREFKKEMLKDIKGIVFRENREIKITKKRLPIANIEDLPFPKKEVVGFKNRGYVYTARGCQYKCVFCICSKYWGRIRYHTAERVIEEIKELIDHKVQIIRFADENFVGNVERLKKIANLIISNNIHQKVKFSCWCRANDVTQEVVNILKSMNIVSTKIGLESGSQKILDYLKGGVTIEDNERAIRLLKEAGIQTNGDFIIGSPEETFDDMMETYDFIKRMPLDFVDVNIFTPYPGTAVWDYALKRGLVSDNMDWRQINIKIHERKGSSIILSEKLIYEEIFKIYKKFRRLLFFKSLKALVQTPWKSEIPIVILKRIIQKLSSPYVRA
ncbi:MAG: radical SAM protein, partial [Candidatus Lokiarchaeota archaeon]|nr:radical SAM protein [Candidatus Lokiarchaeota archaeon]